MRAAVLATLSLAACSLANLDGFSTGVAAPGADGGSTSSSSGGASDSGLDAPTDAVASSGIVDDFTLGKHTATRVDGAKLTLLPGQTRGDFVSRVVDLGASKRLAAIEWQPAAPYLKPLPDERQAESGYARGALDMREDVLLLHIEDGFEDRSSLKSPVGLQGPVSFGPGRFGRAFTDTSQTYAYVQMATGTPFAFGTSDFTWSLWMKTTSTGCTSKNGSWANQVYLGGEDADARPHTWLGCSATATPCVSPNGRGRVSGYISTTQGDGKEWCGTRTLDDSAWHHLALVKSGHASAQVNIYVDGVVDASLALAFESTFDYATPSELSVGAFSKGSAEGQGDATLDEVAVFRRALSATEVAALSARGHLRVTLTARTCASATCSEDPPFVGPGGDAAKTFIDTGLAPPARADVSFLPEARWVQYRFHFETDDAASAPVIDSVRIVTQ